MTGNTGTNAGNYVATASLEEGYGWSDGTVADKTISWTIGMKVLSIEAGDRDVTFPKKAPEFTVTYDGFVNGESETVLGGFLGFECGYDGKIYRETFAIKPMGLTSVNYKINFVDGILSVKKAPVSAPHAATGLIYNGKTQTGVSEGDGYAIKGNTGKDAKGYAATLSLEEGYEWSDGTVSEKEIIWSISKKNLRVTADDKDVNFSDPVPEFTVTYDGFVGGEVENVLAGTLKFGCDYDRTVYVPTFAITPMGLSSDNYEIAFVDGTLTVFKATVTVPDAADGLIYSGKIQTGVFEGTGYTITGNKGKGAGNYVATAKLVSGYKWSDESVSDKKIDWIIAKKDLAVTADDKDMTFLGAVPEFTVTYGKFAETEDKSVLGGILSFRCTYDGRAYKPTFAISPIGYISDNYNIIFSDGILTVGRASATVPDAVTGLIYSGKTQTGVFEGTAYTITCNTGEGAGDYVATASL